MTPTSKETYTKFSSQIATLASSVSGLEAGITVTDGLLLDVSPEVSNQGIAEAIVKLGEYDRRSLFQQCVVRYNTGRMILELAARLKQSPDEVIDDTGIAARLGLEIKTLSNWARVARNCPPSLLVPGIAWSHLVAVDIRLPDDTNKIVEIRGIQEKLLKEAADNPIENTAGETRKKMTESMGKVDPNREPPVDKFQCLLVYALLLRKLRYVDETQDTSVDRMDLIGDLESSENTCINLGIIPNNA